MVWSGCPAADSVVAVMWHGPRFSYFSAWCRPLYIVILSPRLVYPWYMPLSLSDPPIGGCFAEAVGGDGVVDGVTVVFAFCRF
jgi:hypothetical protein